MIRYAFLLSAALLLSTVSKACDCAMELPSTLCETLDPDWAEPDVVVLGVKVQEVFYGMRVRLLQVFDGTAVEGDTITVWGDNGALCRWYTGTWAVGDTVVWALNNTDFLGNEITAGFPPDLEQPGDYHISACGTYWLDYVNGNVVGGIVPGVTSVPIGEFWPTISACMATGVESLVEPAFLLVRTTTEAVQLQLANPAEVRLTLIDAQGRAVLDRVWNGELLTLARFAPGAYIAQVAVADQRRTRRFIVGASTR